MSVIAAEITTKFMGLSEVMRFNIFSSEIFSVIQISPVQMLNWVSRRVWKIIYVNFHWKRWTTTLIMIAGSSHVMRMTVVVINWRRRSSDGGDREIILIFDKLSLLSILTFNNTRHFIYLIACTRLTYQFSLLFSFTRHKGTQEI